MNDAPCKGCADRFVGCHSGCEKYAKFKERIEEINNERRLALEVKTASLEGRMRVKNGKGSLSHTVSWYTQHRKRTKESG